MVNFLSCVPQFLKERKEGRRRKILSELLLEVLGSRARYPRVAVSGSWRLESPYPTRGYLYNTKLNYLILQTVFSFLCLASKVCNFYFLCFE